MLNLTALEVDRSENRIAFNRQRAEELAGRSGQIAEEIAQGGGAGGGVGTRATPAQQRAVVSLREESGTLSERVDGLADARGIARDADSRLRGAHRSAAARRRRRPGESLLRLHGEQKQAEEALVHQAAALQQTGDNESAMLESSIQIRDDAEQAAFEWEAASGQLSTLKQAAGKLQAQHRELREKRELADGRSGGAARFAVGSAGAARDADADFE